MHKLVREALHKKIFFSISSEKTLSIIFQVSSVSLASEDPVDEDSVRNYYLGIADYFFTGEFFFWSLCSDCGVGIE